MQPAGHEILDRLWDEVRFDAIAGGRRTYVAHARLYALVRTAICTDDDGAGAARDALLFAAARRRVVPFRT